MAQNRTGGYDEFDTRRKQADIEKKVVQKEKQNGATKGIN